MSIETTNKTNSPVRLAEIPAVILCGGLGTRLRSVVQDVPKCMARVGERPFLELMLSWLRDSGIRDVILCTGYKSDAVREHFGDGRNFGLALRYSVENEPLGTGGALKHAEQLISGNTFMVLNGDSMVEVDLSRLISDHIGRKSAATITLALTNDVERYGQVSIDPDGKVIAFAEKVAAGAANSARAYQYINGGVYIFQHQVLSLIPNAPPAFSLETVVLPRLIGTGLSGFRSDGYFIDIGVPEDFLRAQEELPRRYGYVHSHSS